MSKTGFVWLIIYLFGVAAAFVRGPMLGLLTYVFTYYTLFSWARGVPNFYRYRFSLLAGFALLFAFLFKKMEMENIAVFRMPQLKWLLFMLLNMIIITPLAVDTQAHITIVIEFAKLTLVYYLIIAIIQNKLYYKWFLYAQLWGNYLLGWQAFTRGNVQDGRMENIGAPGIQNSNSLANHFLLILPFIGNFFLFGKKWEKLAAVCAAPFVLNAIILCNSRGAYLSILIMALVYAIRAKKEARRKVLAVIVLAAVGFTFLASDDVWERFQTVENVESGEDQSTMGRLQTWSAALEMMGEYPLGAGGDGWKELSPIYIPELVEAHGQERSVHNTYLEILTSWGFQGFALFIIFLGSTFWEIHRMRQRTGSGDDAFFQAQALALEAALIGYLVGAIFGARAYVEGLYWYCALVAAISNIQQSEIVKQEELANQKISEYEALPETAVIEALTEKTN